MKHFEPFFSIITPFFNAENFIPKFIEKLKLQSFKNWECIIVDDYSEDNGYFLIKELCSNDERFKIHKNTFQKKIRGPYQARNFGLSLSKGKYICFLDIDDYWKDNMLEIKQKILTKENSIDIIFTDISKCTKGIEKGIIAPIKYIPFSYQLKIHNPIWLSTSTVKRNLILNHRFKCINHEDYLFWAELIRDKPKIKIKYLNKVLGQYNISKNSISSNKFLSLKWHYYCYLKLGYKKSNAILCFFPLLVVKGIVLLKQKYKFLRFFI